MHTIIYIMLQHTTDGGRSWTYYADVRMNEKLRNASNTFILLPKTLKRKKQKNRDREMLGRRRRSD